MKILKIKNKKLKYFLLINYFLLVKLDFKIKSNYIVLLLLSIIRLHTNKLFSLFNNFFDHFSFTYLIITYTKNVKQTLAYEF